MDENTLDFINPTEPLGTSGNANMPSTDFKETLPFQGETLKDPVINFPTYLDIKENVVTGANGKSNLDNQTIDIGEAIKGLTNVWEAKSDQEGSKYTKNKIFSYDNSPDSNAFYKRYAAYGQETFDKIGFSPMRDNEAIFNASTSKFDDFSRMLTHSFWPLAQQGFVAGPKSLMRALSGDLGTDLEDARIYAEAAAIGQSSKGGFGMFMSNTFMNFGYTAGIITESIVEMGVAALFALPTGGASVGVTAANIGRNALTLGRLGKGAKVVADATKARTFGKALVDLKKIGNARALTNWAKVEKGLSSGVGRFLNPLAELTEGVAAGLKASNGLKGFAKASVIGKHTAGGLYRNIHTINAALAEARLEGGMAENTVFDRLYREYQIDNEGERPDDDLVKDMRQQAQAAGWKALAYNVGVIYLSNKIVLDNIYGGKGPISRMLNKSTKDIMDLKTGKLVRTTVDKTLKSGKVIKKPVVAYVKHGVKQYVKDIIKDPLSRNALKAAGKTVGYFKRNVMEGLQENAQEAIAHATENYYIETFRNPDLATTEFAMAQIKHGIGEQFTAQGLETFASGLAMGAFAGPFNAMVKHGSVLTSRIKDPKKYQEYVAAKENYGNKLAETLNSIGVKDFYDNPIWHAGTQMEFNKAMRNAKTDTERDTILHDALKAESMIMAINTAMEHGTMDLYYEQIQAVKDMTQEEFEEAYDLQKGEGKNYLANVDKILERTKKVESKWNEAKEMFPEPSDIGEILERADPNSIEFEQAELLLSAWKQARKNYVFFNESFESTKELMKTLTDDVLELTKGLDIDSADVRVLFDRDVLRNEIAFLKKDVELSKTNENLDEQQKEDLKKKELKLQGLQNLLQKTSDYDNYNKELALADIKQSLKEEDPNITDEELESTSNMVFNIHKNFLAQIHTGVEIAFKDYIRSLHGDKGYEFKNDVIEEASDKYLKLLQLGREQRDNAKLINIIGDEQGFLDMVEKNMVWMKELYDNRRGYYEDIIKKGFEQVENNDILNALADQDIYISPEALEAWVKTQEVPEEFYQSKKEVVIKEGHHKYNDLASIFENILLTRKDTDITDKVYKDKIDKLIAQRDAAIEALPKTTQKVEQGRITIGANGTTVKLITDKIANDQYVEISYSENNEDKTVILYKDKKGVLRYDNEQGEKFAQPTLVIKKADLFIMAEKPNAEDVKAITEEYAQKIADVKAETLAEKNKKGEPFVNITKETPYSAMPAELQALLQQAYIDEAKAIGKPLGEDAEISEEDITAFISSDLKAIGIINNYNLKRNAEEKQMQNVDVEFVDGSGKTFKANELTSKQIKTKINTLKEKLKALKRKTKPSTEDTTKINEYESTISSLEIYLEGLAETKLTDAQRKVQADYKAKVIDKQKDIKRPEETGTGRYEIEGAERIRVSDMIGDLQKAFVNEDYNKILDAFNSILGDKVLTEELRKEFVDKIKNLSIQGFTVEKTKKLLLDKFSALSLGKKVDKTEIKNIVDATQWQETRDAGNYIHQGVETLFNGGNVKLDTDVISEDAYEQLFGSSGIITNLVNNLKASGHLLLGMENIVFNESYAGSMDMLLVAPSGELLIIDIKTGKESKWNKFHETSNQTRLGYNLQLTAYKNLLENLIGKKATIHVLPIEIVQDNKTGAVISARHPSNTNNLYDGATKLIELNSNDVLNEKSVQKTIDDYIQLNEPVAEEVKQDTEEATTETTESELQKREKELEELKKQKEEILNQVTPTSTTSTQSDLETRVKEISSKLDALTDKFKKNGKTQKEAEDLALQSITEEERQILRDSYNNERVAQTPPATVVQSESEIEDFLNSLKERTENGFSFIPRDVLQEVTYSSVNIGDRVFTSGKKGTIVKKAGASTLVIEFDNGSSLSITPALSGGIFLLEDINKLINPTTTETQTVDTTEIDNKIKAKEEEIKKLKEKSENSFTIEDSYSELYLEKLELVKKAKTETEAVTILKEQVENLSTKEIEALGQVITNLRIEGKWKTKSVDTSEVLTMNDIAEDDVIINSNTGESYKVSKTDSDFVAENIKDGNEFVILTDTNISEYMKANDLEKAVSEEKTETKLSPIETENMTETIDTVADFISKRDNLKELSNNASKAKLEDLENDLLNDINC
jgi:3'-phosphoadenosine 5'-phosphosulfate sulfotransferase/low affinity Fe/Cu permease